MNDKIYGAELDLNINKFKSKMKEAQRISKETSKKIAENNKYGIEKDGVLTLSNGKRYIDKTPQEMANGIGKIDDSLKDATNSSKMFSGEISESFTKGLKSVKKLTLGFLGARSAFSLFRKYMSEYQSQNEDFANKMQLTTNVIANTLAPAFEWFGNVIQYVAIGLARIIELLIGVNILGKTVDNGFKGASKSAKEFNDNLSGLDEISNIDTSASGLSSGLASQIKALGDFQDKIKEVDKWFKENPIGKAIKWIADFVKEHPWATLLGLGTFKLLKGTIIPALLGGAGVGGLTKAFLTLGTVVVTAFAIEQWINLIKAIKDAIYWTNEFKRINEEGKEQTQEYIDKNEKYLEKYEKKIKEGTMTMKDWKDYQLVLQNQVNNLELQNKTIKDSQSLWEKITGISKEHREQLQKNNDEIDEYLTKINSIPKEYQTNLHLRIDLDAHKAEQKLSRLFNPWSGFINSYDVGTDYVPRDQIALIHEGERIIPKKYNNSDYLGSMGNSETNALLMELNRSVLEFAKRPSVINVNGKDLAKATYSDYQEEGSRRGTNTSVRRV